MASPCTNITWLVTNNDIIHMTYLTHSCDYMAYTVKIIYLFKKKLGLPVVARWKLICLLSMRIRFNPWPHSVGQESGIAVSYGVSYRHGSDPTLLWLRLWPAAVALIQPLAWELLYAVGAALKSKKIIIIFFFFW